jgi:hypothetical protein
MLNSPERAIPDTGGQIQIFGLYIILPIPYMASEARVVKQIAIAFAALEIKISETIF